MKLLRNLAVVGLFVILPLSARATIVTGFSLGGGTTEYQLNFNGTSQTAAGGNWTSVPLLYGGSDPGQLNPQPNPDPIGLGGSHTLTLTGTYAYWLGGFNPAQPVTSTGWYYDDTAGGTGVNTHRFAISGLSVGDTVSIWATYAWDSSGKAPQIGLGTTALFNGNAATNGTDVGTANGSPGTNPLKTDLVQVATGVVATGGSLQWFLTHPNNGNAEGQLGGMIIDITEAVPEPSTVGLLLMGAVIMAAKRKRAQKRIGR